MTARDLLRVTGVLEGGTALGFLLFPAIPMQLLFGQVPGARLELLTGRLVGAALLSLAMTCLWGAASNIVRAMLLYNLVIIGPLLYSRIGLGLSGIALWPAIIVHVLLAGWCIAVLRVNIRHS